MPLIYEPRGRAREFSPLALNIYDSCDHKCQYCYVPKILEKRGYYSPEFPKPRKDLLRKLEVEARKFAYGEQVLLCFLGDPYCLSDVKYEMTRKVLEILLRNNVTTAILTKGGKRSLRDLDLLRNFKAIKVGATLTFLDDNKSLTWEPYAALPTDRIKTLEILNENQIVTWVSLEPVIDVDQTLALIDRTYRFVQHYKVGKLNYQDLGIDWKDFGIRVIKKLNDYGKKFYIKKDLALYIPKEKMTKEQRNMDYLVLQSKGQKCSPKQLRLTGIR